MTRGSDQNAALGALRLYRPGEHTKLAPRDFVVGGLLACGEAMVLHGQPIGGKSTIAGAIACSVGTGQDFFGRRVRRGVVIYAVAERFAETDRRLQATLGSSEDHLVRFVRVRLFGEPNDADRLIAAIRVVEAETGERTMLLIVDTLVSMLRDGAGDENSQRDVNRFTSTIDEVRSSTGAAVIVIHHSKRGEGRPKGSEVIEAWAETLASVQSVGKSQVRRLVVDRSNTIEPGVKATFKLQPVDLGLDEETGSRSQVVVAASADATPQSASSELPTAIKLSKDVEKAYIELQKLHPPVSLSDWRAALGDAFSHKQKGAIRQTVLHVKTRLEQEGLIIIDGDTVSVRKASI